MPMSVSQWLRVRSVLVLVVAVAGRAVLFVLPGTEPDSGSRVVAAVDYVTSAAVVIAVLGLGWSTGTFAHRAVTAWYERRLTAGMLGATAAPARPWRAVVARSSWTLFTLRLHTDAVRVHWRRCTSLAVTVLAVNLTWYAAAAAAGHPSSTGGAATRTDLEQLWHRYATVAADAAYVCVIGIMLYTFYIGYLVVRGAGSLNRTP